MCSNLLSHHQELMLDSLWRRPLGLEGQFEGNDDPVDNLRLFDKRDNSHLTSTGRTTKRIHLVDPTDHLGTAIGGHIVKLIFSERTVRSGCRKRSIPALTGAIAKKRANIMVTAASA